MSLPHADADTDIKSNTSAMESEKNLKPVHRLAAASMASVFSILFTQPLDTIKTLKQTSGSYIRSMSYIELWKRIDPKTRLYRGTVPHLAALIPAQSLHFITYDFGKTHLPSMMQLPSDSPIIHATSAIAGYTVACFATNPLWLAKNRLQAQIGAVRVPSTHSLLFSVYRNEGIRGLYAGFLPSMINGLGTLIQFPCFEALKLYFAKRCGTKVQELPVPYIALSGAVASTLAGLAMFPVDLLRSKMQVQGYGNVDSLLGPVRSSPSSSASASASASSASSSSSSSHFTNLSAPLSPASSASPMHAIHQTAVPGTIGSVVSQSKSAAAVAVKPSGGSVSEGIVLLKEIVSKEGVKGLYRGLSPQLLRSALGQLISLTMYDVAKRYARNNLSD